MADGNPDLVVLFVIHRSGKADNRVSDHRN